MKGIYLLLGSNVGDRLGYLRDAAGLIGNRAGSLVDWSSVYQTEAWGQEDQADFLNSVLELESTYAPADLLDLLLAIEKDLGRVRRQKWAERVIDIDILYYGRRIITTENLSVPHPEIQNRRFTLVPMCELVPGFVHPVLKRDQETLLLQCSDPLNVQRAFDTSWVYHTPQ